MYLSFSLGRYVKYSANKEPFQTLSNFLSCKPIKEEVKLSLSLSMGMQKERHTSLSTTWKKKGIKIVKYFLFHDFKDEVESAVEKLM